MILKSSESDDESSLKSSFETLENQERLDGHDNFQYLSHLNNTDKEVKSFKRVIDGEMKSPDLLVDPEDGKWNPMVVIIASCCIGRIFKSLLGCLLGSTYLNFNDFIAERKLVNKFEKWIILVGD